MRATRGSTVAGGGGLLPPYHTFIFLKTRTPPTSRFLLHFPQLIVKLLCRKRPPVISHTRQGRHRCWRNHRNIFAHFHFVSNICLNSPPPSPHPSQTIIFPYLSWVQKNYKSHESACFWHLFFMFVFVLSKYRKKTQTNAIGKII